MREYFTYGSVRGAAGNGGPYRDRPAADSVARQKRLNQQTPGGGGCFPAVHHPDALRIGNSPRRQAPGRVRWLPV